MNKRLDIFRILLIILISNIILFGFYHSLCYVKGNTINSCIQTPTDRLKYFALEYDSSKINSNLTPHEPIYITSDLDFSKYNFSGDGSASNPFLIQNYNITNQDGTAIYILNTTKYVIIRNCFLNGLCDGITIIGIAEGTVKIENNFCSGFYDPSKQLKSVGISVVGTSYVIIRNNTCFDVVSGIELYYSPNAIIEYNNCTLCKRIDYSSSIPLVTFGEGNGISVWESPNCTINNNYLMKNSIFGIQVYHSDNSTIANNEFYFNGFKYNLTSTRSFFDVMCGALMMERSSKVLITNNRLDTSNGRAIYLDDCSSISIMGNYVENSTFSLFVYHCTKYDVYNNTFILSRWYGIYVANSTEGLIYWNLVQESTCHALVLDSSHNNTIYYNSFAYTNCERYDSHFWRFPTSEAYDNGKGNSWYNSTIKKGNWWSYWDQKGKYKIDGDAESYDFYPLTEPPISPTGGAPKPPQEHEDIGTVLNAALKQALIMLVLMVLGIRCAIACTIILIIAQIHRKKKRIRKQKFG